jgi:hypothetical protein
VTGSLSVLEGGVAEQAHTFTPLPTTRPIQRAGGWPRVQCDSRAQRWARDQRPRDGPSVQALEAKLAQATRSPRRDAFLAAFNVRMWRALYRCTFIWKLRFQGKPCLRESQESPFCLGVGRYLGKTLTLFSVPAAIVIFHRTLLLKTTPSSEVRTKNSGPKNAKRVEMVAVRFRTEIQTKQRWLW